MWFCHKRNQDEFFRVDEIINVSYSIIQIISLLLYVMYIFSFECFINNIIMYYNVIVDVIGILAYLLFIIK